MPGVKVLDLLREAIIILPYVIRFSQWQRNMLRCFVFAL